MQHNKAPLRYHASMKRGFLIIAVVFLIQVVIIQCSCCPEPTMECIDIESVEVSNMNNAGESPESQEDLE